MLDQSATMRLQDSSNLVKLKEEHNDRPQAE